MRSRAVEMLGTERTVWQRLSGLSHRLRGWWFRFSDELLCWIFLLMLAPLIPRASLLGDPELLAYLVLTLMLGLGLRQRGLLPMPHRALPLVSSRWGALGAWVSALLVPLALLLLGEAVRSSALGIGQAGQLWVVTLGLWGLVLGCAVLAGRAELTAWAPEGLMPTLLLCGFLLLAVGPIIGLELVAATVPTLELSWLRSGFLVGGAFLLAGTLPYPPRNLGQALRSLEQLAPVTTWLGRLRQLARVAGLPILAWAVPVLGVSLVRLLAVMVFPELGFGAAPLTSLLVLLLIGAFFTRPTPVAISCLFREVLSKHGDEPDDAIRASDFADHPEGALTFNPLEVKRTGRMHPALFPVDTDRLTQLDQAQARLWPEAEKPNQNQIFGLAAFEPEGGVPQWKTLTIHKASRELLSWKSESQARLQRMLILRPFSSGWFKLKTSVFDHEGDRFPGQMQSMADPSPVMTLKTGDVVVLSIGGLIRAYEFEICGPLYPGDPLATERMPILEDYLEFA